MKTRGLARGNDCYSYGTRVPIVRYKQELQYKYAAGGGCATAVTRVWMELRLATCTRSTGTVPYGSTRPGNPDFRIQAPDSESRIPCFRILMARGWRSSELPRA